MCFDRHADTQMNGETFILREYNETYKLMFVGVTSNNSDFKPAVFYPGFSLRKFLYTGIFLLQPTGFTAS